MMLHLSLEHRNLPPPQNNMNLLAFIVGITLPTVLGWICLLLLEKNHPVLGRTERWFFSLVLGPTLFTLIVFTSHILGLTKLNLTGFLVPSIVFLLILMFIAQRSHAFSIRKEDIAYAPSIPLSRCMRFSIIALSVWMLIKLLAGAYDLVSVPTYWDDSFNNWNMRGKIFFVTKKLTLQIPNGNGIVQTSEGVSSYPPTVPMLKIWLSVLRGS